MGYVFEHFGSGYLALGTNHEIKFFDLSFIGN